MTKPRVGGTELFAVRFPVETLATLKRLASERGLSAGALVVHLVEAGLPDEGKKAARPAKAKK